MEKRIVTQLLISMDQPNNDNSVLVIGATNRPDAIDPALRRPGRFDREIYIGMPDESAREEILSVLTHNVKLRGPIDLLKIAKSTSAFVASDLKSVNSHAGSLAMKRIICERYTTTEPPEDCFSESWSPEEVEKVAITMSDLEGFGLDLSTGFLLYGPPGCGKTLIAKAVANAAGVSFIHIKGPDILNEYVGVSEKKVRKIFDDARTCAPCILFFDEVCGSFSLVMLVNSNIYHDRINLF
ncbi:hypothetical protein Fmac_020934 [Flemingia macrophylla]|uniref:AAA+ ATPase domain-containing protein n=1 Tax=Flemingia macrophylla TaxID=520843 RepID=A0ABD1LVC9_9FABA